MQLIYKREWWEKNRERCLVQKNARYESQKRRMRSARLDRRIVELYCKGMTRQQIAEMLGLSLWNTTYRLRQCGVTLEREIAFSDKIRAKGLRIRDLYHPRL